MDGDACGDCHLVSAAGEGHRQRHPHGSWPFPPLHAGTAELGKKRKEDEEKQSSCV